MKKIAASIGLVALGASGLQVASAQAQAPDNSKPWAVSATLRGFYDDNFNTLPDDQSLGGYSRETFGYEISPSVSYGLNLETTRLNLAYTYGYRYYENNLYNSSDKNDQHHIITGVFDHYFTERHHINVRDSFVVGQEPDMLRAGNSYATFQRVSGENFRNYGSIVYDADLTRQLGLQIGYDNAYYNYADHGYAGSLSATLDRIEQPIHIDGKWKISPQTTGILGYQFAMTDYTSDDLLTENPDYDSDVRNSRSHYIYVGTDHTFTPELNGSVRAGATVHGFLQ